MYRENRKGLGVTIKLIFIILITAMSGDAFSAFTKVVTFTDSDNDFYTAVTSTGEKIGLDIRDINLAIGQSAKVRFTLPPGVDLFYMKGMEVSSWSGQNGGAMYYAHSLDNLADASDYSNLVRSTALGERVWLYEPGGIGELTTTMLDGSRTVYFVVKNNSGQVWRLFYISVAMRISDKVVYNNWVNGVEPVMDEPTSGLISILTNYLL